MNARFEILRARAAPAALSVAIALAFGLGTPAQAQYTYPGTASSSGHSAHISPMRAGARERADYGNGPVHAGTGNPSMHRGEACPPGSQCGMPASGRPSGGGAPSGAYGSLESYGDAASSPSTRQADTSPTRNASINPVLAGPERGALNYGPSQTSNANFRNTVTGKSNGPNVNTTGQQTSFTGPNGKKVNMDGSQTFTGPNGQKQTIGGGPDLNHLGGGYGHQKGSGIKQGMSYSADGNGSISGTRTGNAPGMASASGINMNNGGSAGVSDQPDDAPKTPDGKANSGGELANKVYDEWGHPHNGRDSHGNTWKDGNLDTGFDDKGVYYKDGKPDPGHTGSKIPGFKGGNNSDTADMGATAGPGEIVSGTGQVVHPGQKKGQDTGGGQGKDGGSTSTGGRNAQGQYVAPSGQDNVKKPKEVGVLKMNYNGKNGAIDPKLNGSNGGGG